MNQMIILLIIIFKGETNIPVPVPIISPGFDPTGIFL